MTTEKLTTEESFVTIRTLWVTRKSTKGEESPELLEAWDEYSMDENPAGAQESFEKALAGVASDIDQFRYIDLNVPSTRILAAFKPTVIGLGNLAERFPHMGG